MLKPGLESSVIPPYDKYILKNNFSPCFYLTSAVLVSSLVVDIEVDDDIDTSDVETEMLDEDWNDVDDVLDICVVVVVEDFVVVVGVVVMKPLRGGLCHFICVFNLF